MTARIIWFSLSACSTFMKIMCRYCTSHREWNEEGSGEKYCIKSK